MITTKPSSISSLSSSTSSPASALHLAEHVHVYVPFFRRLLCRKSIGKLIGRSPLFCPEQSGYAFDRYPRSLFFSKCLVFIPFATHHHHHHHHLPILAWQKSPHSKRALHVDQKPRTLFAHMLAHETVCTFVKLNSSFVRQVRPKHSFVLQVQLRLINGQPVVPLIAVSV